jgi:hypothetical protein
VKNNGHPTVDALLDRLAERAGIRSALQTDAAIAELHTKLDRLASAVERLTELVESRLVNDHVAPLLLSRQAAAKALSISASMLDVLRRDGKLQAVVVGQFKPSYAVSDLLAFIERNREKLAPCVAEATD